jgi:uncharacterized cofD-like protein
VAVADDGGSSGLLRAHTGYLPPGDLRKCLVALAADAGDPWVGAFRQRFEYAHNHSLGNLIITALQQSAGSLDSALRLCEQLLGCVGHVYPSALTSVNLNGRTRDGVHLYGQSNICKSHTALASVSLDPADIAAHPLAVQAIRAADLLVLGPGSLFTSLIPNLLIQEVLKAILESKAAVVFVCSLSDFQGETWGLDAAELVEALLNHGLAGRLDYVLVNSLSAQTATQAIGNVTGMFAAIGPECANVGESGASEPSLRYVHFNQQIEERIRQSGVKLLTRDLIDPLHPSWHSVPALGAALASILANELS